MPDGSSPISWTRRLLSGALRILGAVVALVIAVQLLERIWVALLIVALVAGGAGVGVWWWRRNRTW
jgi:uncharacterized membrane protein